MSSLLRLLTLKSRWIVGITLELVFALCLQYILVVFAKDADDREVDRPLEIQVLVEDVNDNSPVCENEETVFEVQENEPVGKKCLWLFESRVVCSPRVCVVFLQVFQLPPTVQRHVDWVLG